MRRRVELFGTDGTGGGSAGGGSAGGGSDGSPGGARFGTPATGGERELLTAYLDDHRATLELKCAGLGPDQLVRRAVEPSAVSLLGLVRHLADVERRWFRVVLDGQDAPPRFSDERSPDGDFDGVRGDAAAVAEAWAAWREEVAFARRFTAAGDLDRTGVNPHWRGTVSLRWVLLHLVQEYARHNGHADLLRERVDGRVGL